MTKCPSCKATIEDGIRKCPNCKKELKWKHGEPVLTVGQAMQDMGKSLTVIVWGPLLLIAVYYIIKKLL